MKNLRPFSAVPRFPFARSLVLGVGLLLLAASPAGAVSADEQSLFNVAGDDNNGHGYVRVLLAKGASPNVPVEFSSLRRAAIHVAAEQGAVKNLAAMLQARGNPNLPDGKGNTPLHWASTGDRGGMGLTHDHPAVIRLLVRHGVDLHWNNHNGATPLHVAVYIGLGHGSAGSAIIKALLDAGADPKRTDGEGLTALQRFARNGNNEGEIVTLLLKAGADPDRVTPGGDTPLHLAIKNGRKYWVVKALLNGGADPCIQDAEGYTPYQLYHAQEDVSIRQVLDRAQGHDLACNNKKQAEDPQRVEAEQESDDSSEMGYEAALQTEVEREQQLAAERYKAEQRAQDGLTGDTDTDEGSAEQSVAAVRQAELPPSVAALDQQMVTVLGNGQLSKYEVTQALWEEVMGENPSGFKGCAQCPVEAVSWNEIQVFLEKLNVLTGEQYRLPTEAEWTAAVGSGGGMWHGGNSGGRTHPVGQKAPNELGLYDMVGNVWEWVEDCWEGDCSQRVIRGGSWYDVPEIVRPALRDRNNPGIRLSDVGFRLARTLTP